MIKKDCTLFIDTTNNFCYLGLYSNDKLINQTKLAVNKNVTDIIVDAINNILMTSKVKPEALTHMCVNIGPGSFTGVKVGVVVAKAWALVYPKIKISTINSLLLQTQDYPALSIIDAKSKKYYLAAYDKSKVLIKPCLIDEANLDKYLKKYKKANIYRDCVDKMYDNYLLHQKQFKLVKDIDKLEPLYLKDPV